MMLDRTVAPDFRVPEKFRLLEAERHTLKNNVPVHTILTGEQEVVRIEWFFSGGSNVENRNGISWFTNKMLSEGTSSLSALQIQEQIAFYGAFIEQQSGFERDSITIYTLNRYLPELCQLVRDIISNPVFPSDQLEKNRTIALQGYKVNLNKTAFLAGNKFRELLFGTQHYYGRHLDEQAMLQANIEELKDFHRRYYSATQCDIIVSGYPDKNIISTLDKYFGDLPKTSEATNAPSVISGVSTPASEFVEKKDSVQCSIRFGRKMFTIQHEDYFNFYFLNEILGGYFGSRLMQNIREEKGYTYGIHSSLVCLKNSGYFVIGTDVKKEFANDTLSEIRKELKKLCDEKVDARELETVKNYILGSFLGSVNTPFALADKFKSIYFNGLDYSFYDRFFDEIGSMTSGKLQATAHRYFTEKDMIEVVAGAR